ncbi:MAG: helix-turn-helix domain-containing protein [Anaerolineales bacterium]|nr:helix-turn-helix domain-containing protein [Anaerolineales bacterium]
MRKDDYLPHEIAKAVTQDGREVWQPRFIKLDTAFRRETLAKLKGCKLSVYFDLAEHMNREGECWPSMETLAKETDYSRRQVIRAIKELKAMGIISVERGGAAHGRKPVNRYRVNSYVRYCDEGWREEDAPELSIGAEHVGNVTMDGDISSIKSMSEMSLEEDFVFKKTLSEEDSPPKITEGAALRGAKKQPRAARATSPRSDDEVSLAINETEEEIVKRRPLTPSELGRYKARGVWGPLARLEAEHGSQNIGG